MSQRNIIWLATYPKSGTTWVKSLLTAAHQKTQDININALNVPSVANRALIERCLGLKSSDFSRDELRSMLPTAYRYWSSSLNGLGILKTHDANLVFPHTGEALFPNDVTHGVILVVRDPRDVAVSSRHYFATSQDQAIDQINDPDRWILSTQSYLQLPTHLSDWTSHTASWLDSNLKLLLIRYEDLLLNTTESTRKLLDFCGIESTDEAIASAVATCSFDRLRTKEQLHGYSGHSRDRTQPFFRAGLAGQWRQELTATQIDRIVEAHWGMMLRLGYEC